MFSDEAPQATMFASEHQRDRAGVIKFCPFLRSPSIDTNYPEAPALQFINRTDQILSTDNRNVGGRPGRGFHHGCAQGCRMPFGNQDTRGLTGLGRSDNRSEVVRILHPIEYNDERLLLFEE